MESNAFLKSMKVTVSGILDSRLLRTIYGTRNAQSTITNFITDKLKFPEKTNSLFSLCSKINSFSVEKPSF